MSAPEGMTPLDSGTEQGIEWATVRAPVYSAVNGYARVPKGHPWDGLGYDDIEGVEVNGGLTYAEEGWVGFDTLHYGDYWPEMPYADPDATQWTPDLVAAEARRLVRQVAEAGAR